jgi:CheY-like chemotaxis protein
MARSLLNQMIEQRHLLFLHTRKSPACRDVPLWRAAFFGRGIAGSAGAAKLWRQSDAVKDCMEIKFQRRNGYEKMILRSNRILIVDSDGEAAQQLASVFVEEGYDVEISDSISAMAERIRDAKFDCAIMDVDLPEMPGYKAVSILKTIDPRIQVIMTAAENTAALESEVRKQDIFYYYIKSFDRDELIEAVRDVFKKMGKLREKKQMDKSPEILVIDDDPSFIGAMRPVLESKGYQVAAACNREEAMRELKKRKPDVIVLDIMMEKMTDGFDICYKLKHDPEMKNIPVLAVSSITEETGFTFSPATDGEYFEADDFIEKPVTPTVLLERLEKLLRG